MCLVQCPVATGSYLLDVHFLATERCISHPRTRVNKIKSTRVVDCP